MSVSAPHVVNVPVILYPGPGGSARRAYRGDIVRYHNDPAALERARELGFIAPAPADDDAPPDVAGPVAAAPPADRPPFTAPKSAWVAYAVASGRIAPAAAAAAAKHDLIELCS